MHKRIIPTTIITIAYNNNNYIGYTVEGTLAHDLLNNPTEIVCQDNRVKPRR